MTSIKVKFRPSDIPGQEGSIYYQIIHNREVRQISTDYHVMPDEWSKRNSMVMPVPNSRRHIRVQHIRNSIFNDISRLNKIIYRKNHAPISAADIVLEFRRYCNDYTLFNFFISTITKLKENKRTRTAETYRTTLNSFMNFRNGKDIHLDAITPQLMEDYEAWLKARGISPNTSSFYARVLRALYNRAVDREIINDSKPFKRVYTGICKTEKRALPLQIIRRLKTLNLSRKPHLDYARDMFILSFYLRGMSFIDMAFLLKSDLKNGYLTYRRHKTNQKLTILWTNEMQRIIRKYPPNQTEYLIPILRRATNNPRSTYRNIAYNINHNLKTIAKLIGLSMPLTLYVARHSWASVAKASGIPISVISEGMGHDSESTTRIYLASLETSIIDNANSLILRSLQ